VYLTSPGSGAGANANSSVIWLGGPGVTPGSGLPLSPGYSAYLSWESDLSKIYAVSSAANQKLAILGVP
jgi:hypothetical protein